MIWCQPDKHASMTTSIRLGALALTGEPEHKGSPLVAVTVHESVGNQLTTLYLTHADWQSLANVAAVVRAAVRYCSDFGEDCSELDAAVERLLGKSTGSITREDLNATRDGGK